MDGLIFLVNRNHKILFSCRYRGEDIIIVTCMHIEGECFRRYFMPKIKYKKKEKLPIYLLEVDRFNNL